MWDSRLTSWFEAVGAYAWAGLPFFAVIGVAMSWLRRRRT